jgi:hypothetical protein
VGSGVGAAVKLCVFEGQAFVFRVWAVWALYWELVDMGMGGFGCLKEVNMGGWGSVWHRGRSGDGKDVLLREEQGSAASVSRVGRYRDGHTRAG